MWCVPKLDQECVTRMEEVLDILNQPADERAPVVALDERPVQLLDAARPGTPMAPGKVAHRDYEYMCCGTANVFCVGDPLSWSVNIFKKHHKLIVYYKGRMFKNYHAVFGAGVIKTIKLW